MDRKPIYLAPYDFDIASQQNLKNALRFAELNDGEVFLLHVVAYEKDRFPKLEKLYAVKQELTETEQSRVQVRVTVGNFIDDINKAASILRAEMVIMSIQNPVTFGSLFASPELKLIANSHVPYFIAQKDVELGKVDHIAFPFSYAKETIQVVKFLAGFAKQHNAKIHLVPCHKEDEILEKQTVVNEKVLKKYLSESGVNFDIIDISANENFDKAFIKYIDDAKIDVIGATFYSRGFFNPNSFIQEMINNDCKVPLITVDAEEFSHATNQFSFIGV